MTDTKSEAREFWIPKTLTGEILDAKKYGITEEKKDKWIHVIEYKAYEVLLKIIKRFGVEGLEFFEQKQKEYNDLKAKHERVLQMLDMAVAQLQYTQNLFKAEGLDNSVVLSMIAHEIAQIERKK